MKAALLGAFASLALMSASAATASVDEPLPTDLYITFNGADWAWISPCSATSPSCGDTDLFEFQASEGWRLPTAEEFLLRPQASDFGTSSNFACATPYFSDVHTHCDYSDGAAGFIWTPGGESNFSTVETWAIRNSAAPAVPEPGTWAMMLLGFGAAGFSFRRSQRRNGELLQQA